MVAFGQNPWGYADERAKRAVELQNAYYLAQGLGNPTWMTAGQGTVSYPFSGKGPGPGLACTTLAGAITASSASIPVANASCLSLSSLPTGILIGNSNGTQEMVRICSTTATSGPATLTACYDGRGLASYPFGNVAVVATQPWPSGTTVGEYRISGTGTLFGSDARRPLCPAGLPGPPGPVVYSTGSVTLSGGSPQVTGNATTWTTANNVIASYMIRVAATHAGGTPFDLVGPDFCCCRRHSYHGFPPGPLRRRPGAFPLQHYFRTIYLAGSDRSRRKHLPHASKSDGL